MTQHTNKTQTTNKEIKAATREYVYPNGKKKWNTLKNAE